MADRIGAEYVFRLTVNGYPLDSIIMNRSRSWDVFMDEQHVATVRTRQEAETIIRENNARL